jgi:hypothetical protein
MSSKWWLLSFVLVTHCVPRIHPATEAQAAATGVVLRMAHFNVRTGGVLWLINASTTPYVLTRPYPCSVYIDLYDAQHQALKRNRWVKFPCPPSGGPALLAPGDSVRYDLPSPQHKHDEEELRKATSYEVVYFGHIRPQQGSKRAQRILEYRLKITGSVE